MADSGITVRAVLHRLRTAGLVEAAQESGIRDFLAHRDVPPQQPWYVSALAGVGAWLAALCFISFLFAADLIPRWEAEYLFPWGLSFLVASLLLRRFCRGIFPVQLALAVSAAGHALTLGGVGDLTDETGVLATVAVVLCAVQYPLNRDSVHRFLSTLTAVGFVFGWILEEEFSVLLYTLIAVEMVLVGRLFTWGRAPAALRPLAHALTVGLVVTHLAWVGETELVIPLWPARVLGVAWMLWVLHWCAGGGSLFRHESLAVAVVVAVILGVFMPPGLLAALGLMVLGHALGEWVLLGSGAAFVPVFIVAYYLRLDLTMDLKAYHLMGAGLLLLVARGVLARRPWARKEAP